jgi:hypothetical protein
MRRLLGEILLPHQVVEDFEVEHDFPSIGRKMMQLKTSRLVNRPRSRSGFLSRCLRPSPEGPSWDCTLFRRGTSNE